ncbi:MAG: TolC family protein [Prevotella sp.]|nr:TolC family protein [Prevotella sp.]
MRKLYVILTMMLPLAVYGQTLQECQQAAERNYPLIRQYGLTEKTTALTVENIGKAWLPQVTATAQATYQSDVTAWPEQMQAVYQQMGLNMKGLRKDQYRVGIDVSQTVYDGGAIRSQKDIARMQGAVEQAQTEVTMYQVRRRVNEMYFAMLLADEQIRLNADLEKTLAGSEDKLSAMFHRGTASESDYLSVRAERLKVAQQGEDLKAQRKSLAMMLSTFCGIEVRNPSKPAAVTRTTTSTLTSRPELKVIEARLRLADVQEESLDAALKPRLGVFAQGFYGYPGYNLFEDMMHHRWSWNGMVGARLSWNIGALYTRKNDKAKIQLMRDMAENSRDVFMYNNTLEQIQHNDNTDRYRRMMQADDEIVSLRTSVRQAAESKLSHGIIDVNDLLKEINAENNAQTQRTIHEIQMLKEMYELSFTINQ